MRIFKWILVGLVALSLLFLGGIGYIGAWKIVFPDRTHETVAPELPAELARPSVLLFSKTNSFRHKDGIPAGLALFERFVRERGGSTFATENGAVFSPELLARFDTVVFNNASGDTLNEEQEAAFIAYLEAGGGWIGIHAAGDSSHKDWEWYVETLIGGLFTQHTMGPQFQDATLVVEDATHPATKNLPASWTHNEEWYSWDKSARDSGANILVKVDESTYSPRSTMFGSDIDLRMGDHPMVWSRCIGKGRALYSGLGHAGAAYETPEYAALLEGAFVWTTGLEGEGCR